MTDPRPPILPDRQLDAAEIRRLLDCLSDAATAETADFAERALSLATPQDGGLDG